MEQLYKIIESVFSFLVSKSIEVIGIGISCFIAYHIFFLSKRLSNQNKLEHKEKIKKIAEELIDEVHSKFRSNEVYLVNTNRYFKDYPGNQEKLGSGYSHIKAEIKATRFNGVQFFCSMPQQAYISTDGKLNLKSEGEEAFIVYPVGLVPYEWIEYVDQKGDEHGWRPLFFCRFKGNIYWRSWWRRLIPFGYPYKELLYYKKSETYRDGYDPKDWEWSHVEIER